MPNLLAALLLAAAPPAVVLPEYTVRNDTPRAFTCGLRRYGRSVIDRFVLRAGAEWRQADATAKPRILYCDSQIVTQRYRMQPGVRYALVVSGRTGRVMLRPQRD